MKKKRVIAGVIVCIALVLAVMLFFIRAFSERHLDDVSPFIECSNELLDKADVFYVIPLFENKSIGDNKTWCSWISGKGKRLAMHGVYHSYNEFLYLRDEEYINVGVEEFEKCFGFKPNEFKPPQLALSDDNLRLLERMFGKVRTIKWQVFHKTYHCNDTGLVRNWVSELV